MGAQLDTWQLVEAPAVIPQPYGIFSVVEPRLITDEHWRLGVQWQSQACEPTLITEGPCIVPRGEGGLSNFGVCSVFQYEPFTVYAYNTDAIGGYTLDEHMAHTVQRLINGEQKSVEARLWSGMAASVAPSSLTPFSPEYGLGWLEQSIATNYNGQGVIHMNKLAATVFSDTLIYPEGGRMRTNLGTPVVVSAAYDTPTIPPDGTANIYATGPLVMYRGDIDTREDAIDKARNEVSIVAQRDYVIGWDCSVSAVQVTLSPTTP